MGLLYIYPTEENPADDRILKTAEKTILKTYGLPMIFWAQYLGIVAVIAIMYLAALPATKKMLTYDDLQLRLIALGINGLLILTPLIILCFFFYEEVLIKTQNKLTLQKKIFWIPFFKKTYQLTGPCVVSHFLGSPNEARRNRTQSMAHYENKGYFQLFITTNTGHIFIDRHSRKSDLLKIADLLNN